MAEAGEDKNRAKAQNGRGSASEGVSISVGRDELRRMFSPKRETITRYSMSDEAPIAHQRPGYDREAT